MTKFWTELVEDYEWADQVKKIYHKMKGKK